MTHSCSFMFVVYITTICLVIVSKWNDLLKLMKSQYGKVSMLKYGRRGWRGDFTFLMAITTKWGKRWCCLVLAKEHNVGCGVGFC
jgi:hypothetical protein